jgi:hypothetical protein
MSLGDAAVGRESIPYQRRDRTADRRSGRRDGRRRIPSYTDLTEKIAVGKGVSAPYPQRLLVLSHHDVHNEYLALDRHTAGGRRRLINLRRELVEAGTEVERATFAVAAAEAPLTAAEMLPRNPTELSITNTPTLAGRRNAMRERRIGIARAEKVARIDAVGTLTRQIVLVQDELRQQFLIAQAQARQVNEYYGLRIAAYWQGVTLAHPEGRQLALMLPAIMPTLPAWVTLQPVGDPDELGRWYQPGAGSADDFDNPEEEP